MLAVSLCTSIGCDEKIIELYLLEKNHSMRGCKRHAYFFL